MTCKAFGTPERLPFMNIRSAFGGLRVCAGLCVLVLPLCGCAVGVGAEIVSYGTSGKSIGDHVLDVVTGKDCNLVEWALRSERDICEPRETEVTTRDFKGLFAFKGLSAPGNSPEGRSADPSLAAGPSVSPSGPFDSGPSGDPGGPSGSELY
jgi:hypothetical protein